MSERSLPFDVPRPRSPYVLDGLVAAAIGSVSLAAMLTIEATPQSPREADLLGVVLLVAACGSLAFRRRWPLAVLAVAGSATIAAYLAGYPEAGMPFTALIALYTVASRCTRRTTVAAAAVVLVLVPTAFVIADRGDLEVGTLVGNFATFGLAAIWGDRKKVREAYLEQLELRAAEKERERLEAAERAVGDERLRIARELHDIVAHAMSVVAVQSGVGVHVIDTRPAEAKRILQTISDTSRDSLTEMRRLLGVLRAEQPETGAGTADLAPAPGLEGLGDLARRVTEAGVPVQLTVRGERPAVPAGVDLAAYRIAQEALTNVLKHAGRAEASVLVEYGADAVRVEVVDDGRGAGASAGVNGSGHGLVGMRERVLLYGGTLDAGPRPGGGYRVAATLPFAGRP